MNKAKVISKVAILGVLFFSAGSLAAQIPAGLPAGSLTESIPVSDVTGPYKGERICYVCDFESLPNVLAFVSNPSDDAAKMIVDLNRLYLKHKARNFKAVVMVMAGNSSKKWLEDLNRNEKLEIPLTYFTKGPKDAALRVYKLNPEVTTFLVTVNRLVEVNISGITSEEFGQVADATEVMMAGKKAKP